MRMFKIRSVVIAFMLLQGFIATGMAQDTNNDSNSLSLPHGAEVLETGVLMNTVGYRGDVMGAEVKSVVKSEDGKSELIEVSIPLDLDLNQVDRVSIFSSTGQRINLNEPLELSMDHKNNSVGITLSLPRKTKMEFVIRLIDLPEE